VASHDGRIRRAITPESLDVSEAVWLDRDHVKYRVHLDNGYTEHKYYLVDINTGQEVETEPRIGTFHDYYSDPQETQLPNDCYRLIDDLAKVAICWPEEGDTDSGDNPSWFLIWSAYGAVVNSTLKVRPWRLFSTSSGDVVLVLMIGRGVKGVHIRRLYSLSPESLKMTERISYTEDYVFDVARSVVYYVLEGARFAFDRNGHFQYVNQLQGFDWRTGTSVPLSSPSSYVGSVAVRPVSGKTAEVVLN
jgi:hypothetical protein